MTILKQSYDFLQDKLLPNISKRHKSLFSFGFEALTIRPYVSLNGNSRVTIKNRSTAQSKIYRLVSQQKMLSYFPQLVTKFGLVTEKDFVNVDFSTFGGFQVLTFAKQTHLGRASQVWDKRENLILHFVHQNRFTSFNTDLVLQVGQYTFFPNTILRRYFLICASDGICRN